MAMPTRHQCHACNAMVEIPHDCPRLGMAFKTLPQPLTNIEKVLVDVATVAHRDMAHKNIFQLLASCSSELGELSDELLIKYKVFGSTYKKLDEGPRAEAVDLVIAALAVYYAESRQERIDNVTAQKQLADMIDFKLEKWVRSQNHQVSD